MESSPYINNRLVISFIAVVSIYKEGAINEFPILMVWGRFSQGWGCWAGKFKSLITLLHTSPRNLTSFYWFLGQNYTLLWTVGLYFIDTHVTHVKIFTLLIKNPKKPANNSYVVVSCSWVLPIDLWIVILLYLWIVIVVTLSPTLALLRSISSSANILKQVL